ncbi:MAG: hypothetical protein QOJ10_1493, partial [Chloroflexota bacterium]|nr:hypothetical protein [Chloroflexota bacterium]
GSKKLVDTFELDVGDHLSPSPRR